MGEYIVQRSQAQASPSLVNYLVVKAGQEALELAGVLALPSVGLLLVGPLALQKGVRHAELCNITANSVTALTLLEFSHATPRAIVRGIIQVLSGHLNLVARCIFTAISRSMVKRPMSAYIKGMSLIQAYYKKVLEADRHTQLTELTVHGKFILHHKAPCNSESRQQGRNLPIEF